MLTEVSLTATLKKEDEPATAAVLQRVPLIATLTVDGNPVVAQDQIFQPADRQHLAHITMVADRPAGRMNPQPGWPLIAGATDQRQIRAPNRCISDNLLSWPTREFLLGSEHYPPKILLDQRDRQPPQDLPKVGRACQDLDIKMPSGLPSTGSGHLSIRSERLGEQVLDVIAVELIR